MIYEGYGSSQPCRRCFDPWLGAQDPDQHCRVESDLKGEWRRAIMRGECEKLVGCSPPWLRSGSGAALRCGRGEWVVKGGVRGTLWGIKLSPARIPGAYERSRLACFIANRLGVKADSSACTRSSVMARAWATLRMHIIHTYDVLWRDTLQPRVLVRDRGRRLHAQPLGRVNLRLGWPSLRWGCDCPQERLQHLVGLRQLCGAQEWRS